MAALEASLSEHELSEWMAFAEIEPFGEFAAYHRTGIITSHLLNVHIPKDKPAMKPTDFMRQYVTSEVAQGVAPLADQARSALRAVFGGKRKNGGD